MAATRDAYNLRVFGSFARGEAHAWSDVDLLVDVEPGRSLLDIVGRWQALKDLLHCRVDLLTERGLWRSRG